ncbi:hypothetical protein FF1_043536 [Malus domestica]
MWFNRNHSSIKKENEREIKKEENLSPIFYLRICTLPCAHVSSYVRWRRIIHNRKRNLQEWSRGKSRGRKIEISNLTKALDNLQMDWANNADQIRETTAEIDRLEAQEEKFWKQQSTIKWHQVGDSNTAFFHHSTVQRSRHNTIKKLKISNENWVEGESGIRSTIEEYFRNLFTTRGHRDWGCLLDCVKQVVTAEMNEVLTWPVDDDERRVPDGQPQSPGP